jgi:uncharacterized protein
MSRPRTDPGRVHYGIARVDVHLPGVGSLKGKRALLNRIKAALHTDLGVSVAEVGAQDTWQRAVLGVAVAASTATGVERILDRLAAVIERDPRVEVLGITDLADTLDDDGALVIPPPPSGRDG